MTTPSLTLLRGRYAVARLAPDAALPAWSADGEVTCVARTPSELSIVCDEASVPPHVSAERGFRALGVDGALDFALTGILASVTGPLAAARISLFAFSTFDTDYVLVKDDRLDAAVTALRAAGLTVAASLP